MHQSIELGLYGAISIRKPGEPTPDREFVVYLQQPPGFDTINGRAFIGNTPTFHAKVGDLVQWDVLALGDGFHVFHVHGHRWLRNGAPTRLGAPGPLQHPQGALGGGRAGHVVLALPRRVPPGQRDDRPLQGGHMTSRTLIAATIVTAAALAGAAPIIAQTHPGGATGATENAVTINDAGYSPADMVVVAPGQHVIWTNGGINPHSVTADDPSRFDSGTLQPRPSSTSSPRAATGIFAYHCISTPSCTERWWCRRSAWRARSWCSWASPRRSTAPRPGTAAGTAVVRGALANGVFTQIAATTVAADGTFQFSTPALTTGGGAARARRRDHQPHGELPVAPRVTSKRAAAKRTLKVTVQPAHAGKARLERLNLDTFRWGVVRQFRIGSERPRDREGAEGRPVPGHGPAGGRPRRRQLRGAEVPVARRAPAAAAAAAGPGPQPESGIPVRRRTGDPEDDGRAPRRCCGPPSRSGSAK